MSLDSLKCDREIGEYMKQTFRNMSGSSLPKSMPLPMKPSSSSSSSSRKIMEEIKRSLSGNMVTTNQIAEQFYKLMGVSAGGSQINDLAVKLERENNTCRHTSNCPCSAPRDKVEQLSAKCLDDCYCGTSLNSSEQDNLKKGFYKVSLLDKVIFAVNKDYFWNRLYKDSSDKSINEEARKGVGLSMTNLEGNNIFVATKKGRDSIRVGYNPSSLDKISSKAEERLKCIVLYYNAMYNKSQKEIIITSTKRTPEDQAKEVYKSVFYATDKLAINSMYKGNAGRFTEDELKKGTPEQTIKDMLALGIKEKRFTGFRHIDDPDNTADIGFGSNPNLKNSAFESVLRLFRGRSFVRVALIPPEGEETVCYHMVING